MAQESRGAAAGAAALGLRHIFGDATYWYVCAAAHTYQNAKQESFWGRVEGRLMAMLEGEQTLTLELLNEATQAWRIVVNSAGIPPHAAHRAQGHAAGALPGGALGGAQVP